MIALSPVRTRASLLALALAQLLLPVSAGAQEIERAPSSSDAPLPGRTAIGLAALDRPTGIAEFGAGWLSLPGASVCVDPEAEGCPQGDSSFLLEAWQLYRPSRRWAAGAGLLLALIPTTDAPLPKEQPPPAESPGGGEQPGSDAKREHTRQYFTVEGTFRYYPYVGETVEWWVGLTAGLVVVSDRFVVDDESPDRALLGPQGVTIRTEGGTLSIAGGPVVALTQNWTVGGTLRYGQWFLPDVPAKDPLGSVASLTGRNTVASLSVNVGYRIGL